MANALRRNATLKARARLASGANVTVAAASARGAVAIEDAPARPPLVLEECQRLAAELPFTTSEPTLIHRQPPEEWDGVVSERAGAALRRGEQQLSVAAI